MSTSATLRTMPPVDGRLVAAIAVVVGVAFLLAARISIGVFAVLAIAGLLLTAYAAHRWPLPTLVAAAIATLADPVITPRVLPAGINPEPIGLSEPILAVVGIMVAADALRRGTFWSALRDPVLPLAVLFVALAVLSAIVNAVPPEVALLGIVMTVDAIAIYFTARMVPMGDRAGGLAIAAVVGAAVVAALFGIAQAALDPNLLGFPSFEGEFGEGGRISSFIGNPNMVAAVVALAIPFAVYGSRQLADGRWRWAARAALFVLVLALLLTFSRGGWLAVAVGGLLGVLVLDWRSLPILVVAAVLAWGAATVMPHNLLVPAGGGTTNGENEGVTPPPIIDSTVDRLGNLSDRNDTRGRFLRDGLRIIADNPVLGVGPGRYGGGASVIYESPVYEKYDATLFGYRTVHNFWLHLLGESGIVGVAVFLTMLAGLFIRLVRGAWAATGVRFVILAGAATALLVASVNSVTEMIFEGNMPVLLVWLILGIASTLAPVTPIFRRASPDAAA